MTFSQNQQQKSTSPRTFGYLRVSTIKQDVEKNKKEILLFAHEKKLPNLQFVDEICSGKISWKKRKIGQILEEAKEGDAIVTSEFSRLTRSMLQCLEILSVAMQKKVSIYILKGGWELNDSLQSKVLAFAFSLVSEVERDLISARTVEALRAKREAGVILGRPKGKVGKSKLDEFRVEIESLLSNGASEIFLARRYHSSPSNFCLWMKKHNIQKPNPHL